MVLLLGFAPWFCIVKCVAVDLVLSCEKLVFIPSQKLISHVSVETLSKCLAALRQVKKSAEMENNSTFKTSSNLESDENYDSFWLRSKTPTSLQNYTCLDQIVSE